MNKKYDHLSLNPITEEIYQKNLNSQQFIDYSGPNADILIQQLPCPDVFFNNKIHVLIDKKCQDRYNYIVDKKWLDLDPDSMHILTDNLFPYLENIINHYGLINLKSNNGFYLFYEDWRFVAYYYDFFLEESTSYNLLQSSDHSFFEPINCSLVYLGDYSRPDFRLVNPHTAADILKLYGIEFKFNPIRQCFTLEKSTFRKNDCQLLGLCNIRLVEHNQLGNLLSRVIDSRRQDMNDDDLIDPELYACYQDQIESANLKND